MVVFDFSEYELSGRSYGGTEKKLGILIDGRPFMLKFQKNTPFGLRYNHISEYLGSHVYQMLGIKCQDTYLGTYNGKAVVACRDFVTDGYTFVPFNGIGESTIEVDREAYQYSYEDIVRLLDANRKLTDVNETISSFFDMYIVDAFIGNFDRHGANWGFLKKNGKYSIAPVFDNGSCLYPNMTDDDDMEAVLESQEEIDRRIYEFPTSQIRIDGRKSSYYDVISSLAFPEMNASLCRIYERTDMDNIYRIIDELPVSDTHRKFYKVMLQNRYEKIIRYSYMKLKGEKDG